MTDETFLDVTPEAGRDFMMRGITGPVVMLNLLRFREIADYTESPELAGPEPVTGAAAFQRYIDHTLPFLTNSGGDMTFLGEGGSWLIGPPGERWDLMMTIRQASVTAFMAWANNPEYLKGIGHRTAAIEDSRILPLIKRRDQAAI
jgi:hypothetical protein